MKGLVIDCSSKSISFSDLSKEKKDSIESSQLESKKMWDDIENKKENKKETIKKLSKIKNSDVFLICEYLGIEILPE